MNPTIKYLLFFASMQFCPVLQAACKEASVSTDYLLNLDLKELMNVETVSTASKKEELAIDAPAVMSIVQCDEIERFGGNNLTEVLERTTNLYLTGSGYFPQNSISMRGDSVNSFSTHVLLLFDGRPIREGQTGGTVSPFLLSFPVGMVERIEILRDPGSVLYGSGAYVGVINIIPKRPSKDGTEGNVKIKGGSFNAKAGEAQFFWKKDDADLTLATNYFVEDGWSFKGFDNEKNYSQGNYGEENVSVVAAGHYKGFKFDSFWLDSRQNMRGNTWPIKTSDHRWIYANLGYTENWNDHHRTEFNGTVNQMNVEMTIGAPAFADANSSLIEATHFYTGENWQALIGGTANVMVGEVHTNWGDGIVTKDMPQYENYWYTLYSQMDYKLWNHLKLTIGGQAVKAGVVDWEFVPRGGLTYHHPQGWGFKTLYGEAYRAANVNENDINIPFFKGNPNLSPEMIKTVDAQVFYQQHGYQFALTYYHSLQQHLIIDIPPTGKSPSTNINGKEMAFQGVELESKAKLFDERLFFTSSLAYQTNEFQGITHTTLVPDWLGKVGVSYSFDQGFSAGLFHNFSTRAVVNKNSYPFVMDLNPVAKPTNLMTLKLSADLKKMAFMKLPFSLNLYAYNLLDNKINLPILEYGTVNTIPQRSGQSFYFSMEYNF
jgi:outer membrane receptor for ferrienterochelin and colicins